MKKIILASLVMVIGIYFSGCSSVTEVTGTWKKPGTTAKKYNKIAVLGVSHDIVKRSKIEQSLVRDFRSYGINAVAGSSILPENVFDSDGDGKTDDKEKVKQIIAEKLLAMGIDGAFVVSLMDVKESERYVPGTTYYAPYNSYYPFYNYYWSYYDRVSTPGYYTKTTQVFFASNFYDVKSETLLWSGQSETVDPTSLTDFAKSYSNAIVTDFIDAGVIRK